MRIAFLFALALALGAVQIAGAACPNERAMVTSTFTPGTTLVCEFQTCAQDYVKQFQYWCEGGAPNKECQAAMMVEFEARTSHCNSSGGCTTAIEYFLAPGKKTVGC